MTPTTIPDDWDDNGIILFEEFCNFIRTRPRTVRDWRQAWRGSALVRFQGTGRLYTTVGEVRRFIAAATTTRRGARSDG